jgi:hypothetical protein
MGKTNSEIPRESNNHNRKAIGIMKLKKIIDAMRTAETLLNQITTSA